MDNGGSFTTQHLKIALAKLGIKLKHAPLDTPAAKGKVEKYHQVVDQFINEAKLQKIKTLEELNRYWKIYVEEYYHKDPHSGIEEYYVNLGRPVPSEGITPLEEWMRDTRPLSFYDVSVVAEAFLRHEKRTVDKGACISFHNRKYETKTSLIGCEVEISYDPMDPEELTISYPGVVPFTARPLRIREYCDPAPVIPVTMQTAEPASSRLLDALVKKAEQSVQSRTDAISFRAYKKDGEENHV